MTDGPSDASELRAEPSVFGARRMLYLGIGAVLLAGIAILATAMSRGVGQDPTGSGPTGFSTAPDFTLTAFDGRPFTLSAHADGPVFLYFWASWCQPCRKEAPLIERLWQEYERRGFTFVGINIWDSEKDARTFIDEFGLTFPNVHDAGGKVYLEYGVAGLPQSFFLKPGLSASGRFYGELSEEPLRRMLEASAQP